MIEPIVEHHPFKPFLPVNAKVLMLGSFPPQPKRWCMDFYYPNLQNDMWRIMGLIFFNNKDYFLTENKKSFKQEAIIEFLNEKGIALFDTAISIRRLQDNASDKFLEIVVPTNIPELLNNIPECCAIVTTGEKATETIKTQIEVDAPKVGTFSPFLFHDRQMRLYRMPSSSRAYPMSVDNKAAIYKTMFDDLDMT